MNHMFKCQPDLAMTQRPDRRLRGVQLFCWLIILIGIGAAAVGAGLLWKGIRTEHWPVVEGVILSADMRQQSAGHGSRTYSPEVTYTYRVGNSNYAGSKIAVGQMSSSREYAQAVLQRFPVGQKVSVHYAADDPSEAVLESGIHGGTWICLGVGTAFTLFGIMFLQIMRAAVSAQLSASSSELSSVHIRPGGRITMDQPPVLMGVIFLLAGIGLSFVPADKDKPSWLMSAVGAFFFCGGVMLLLMRLENKIYSKIARIVYLIIFLAILHWVSFGAGDRMGRVTTPFSVSQQVNLRASFAVFTILMDLALVAGLIRWMCRRLSK